MIDDKESIASFIGDEKVKAPRHPIPAFARPSSKVWTPPSFNTQPGLNSSTTSPSRANTNYSSSKDRSLFPPTPRRAPSVNQDSRYPSMPKSSEPRVTLNDLSQPISTPPALRHMPSTSSTRSLTGPGSGWNGAKPIPGPVMVPSPYSPGRATAGDFRTRTPIPTTGFSETSHYSTMTDMKGIPMALRPGTPGSSSSMERSPPPPPVPVFPKVKSEAEQRENRLLSLYEALAPASSQTAPPKSMEAIPESVNSAPDSSSPSPVRTIAEWKAKLRAARPTAPQVASQGASKPSTPLAGAASAMSSNPRRRSQSVGVLGSPLSGRYSPRTENAGQPGRYDSGSHLAYYNESVRGSIIQTPTAARQAPGTPSYGMAG